MNQSHFEKAKKIASQYGLQLMISSRESKKYMFRHPYTGKLVHFGAKGYEDYLDHMDTARRLRYHKRHCNRFDENGNPYCAIKYTPSWASLKILW